MFTKRRVILDCDPGHDDILAILLAANHPDLELLGITIVAGNATLEKTTRNALNFCSFADIVNVPISSGMSRGLLRPERVNQDSEIHGKTGLDGFEFPNPKINTTDRHGVCFIIETVRSSDRPVTIISTGPLSNVAMALLLEPNIKSNIDEIVMMGGAVNLGNRSPAAEFNIWSDPESAKVVFESDVPITMVGLEATHKAQLQEADVIKLRSFKHPLGKALADLMEFALFRYQDTYETKGLPIHDICAVAVAIDNTIATLKRTYIGVETYGEFCAGRTVCDFYNRYEKAPNARVAVDLEGEKVLEMLYQILGNYDEKYR